MIIIANDEHRSRVPGEEHLLDLVDAEGKVDTARQGTVMERENT